MENEKEEEMTAAAVLEVPTSREERNKEIVREVVEHGRTLHDVGEEHGLTRERVRQILLEAEPGFSASERRKRRAEKRAAAQAAKRAKQLADASEAGRTSVATRRSTQGKRYSDEEMLDRIRSFAEEHGGKPPTTTEWLAEGCSPTVMIYVRRFGSWAEAKRKAGFETKSRTRTQHWTYDEIVEIILRFLQSPPIGEGQYGAKHYETWRRENEIDAPSITSMYLFGGTWSEMKREAIERGKRRGVL